MPPHRNQLRCLLRRFLKSQGWQSGVAKALSPGQKRRTPRPGFRNECSDGVVFVGSDLAARFISAGLGYELFVRNIPRGEFRRPLANLRAVFLGKAQEPQSPALSCRIGPDYFTPRFDPVA